MSSSKIFKGRGDFQPAQLVPRPSDPKNTWQAVAVAEQAPTRARQEDGGGPNTPAPDAGPQVGDSPPSGSVTQDPDHPEADDTAAAATTPLGGDTPAGAATQPADNDVSPVEPSIDLAKLREAAYQEGLAQGRGEALAQAEADFGSACAALQQISEQLSVIRETILKNSRTELIELVFALAEKIIRHSVREQDQTILATVEEALNRAVRSSEFTIYLHPDDRAVIKSRVPEFVASLNGLEQIAVRGDPAIDQGGCRIESDTCIVDATVASQLDIIREQLKNDAS